MDKGRGVCRLAAVAVRSMPSHRAEMVNQLLQGDTFDVLEQRDGWTLIRGHYDGYEGWIDGRQYVVASDVDEMKMAEGSERSPSAYAERHFMGAPYLWGGRTAMGIDCSGLTQVCFKECGVRLLRDARQQATQGVTVDGLRDAVRDDLLFFGDDREHITHVGVYLGDGKLIHSSAYVHVSQVDENGIFEDESRAYTHRLQMIRRVMG